MGCLESKHVREMLKTRHLPTSLPFLREYHSLEIAQCFGHIEMAGLFRTVSLQVSFLLFFTELVRQQGERGWNIFHLFWMETFPMPTTQMEGTVSVPEKLDA